MVASGLEDTVKGLAHQLNHGSTGVSHVGVGTDDLLYISQLKPLAKPPALSAGGSL